MNFDDTPAEAAFRSEVRAWLDANAPAELLGELRSSGFGFSALRSVDPLVAAKAREIMTVVEQVMDSDRAGRHRPSGGGLSGYRAVSG